MATRPISRTFINFIKNDPKEDQYFSFEAETDSEAVIQGLSFMERIHPDQALMLCNRSHPKLQYVGSNCRNIFGFDHEEFKHLTVQDFFNRIHPDDIENLQQCFEFINSSEPYDPITHRFVIHYRFKEKGGTYLHLRDEKLAIESDNGKYIYFTMFKNVTLQEKFFHVKLDIFQHTKGNVLKVYTYNPRQSDHSITPRQNEIIKLLIKGFSTQEIADRMNVSVNTVKNHKQVLFRKVNVKSSVELINFAARHQS
jgi:DNA-binding CsgD family transcriptional regulator